jgi:hypothetical protein
MISRNQLSSRASVSTPQRTGQVFDHSLTARRTKATIRLAPVGGRPGKGSFADAALSHRIRCRGWTVWRDARLCGVRLDLTDGR